VGRLSFLITGTVLAMFVMGRAESFLAHRGLGGSQAWAQDWYDSSGDSSSEADDSESKSKTPPPDIAGTYTGTIDDHKEGSGAFTMEITQTGGKLSGSFFDFFNSGTISGTVTSKDKVKMRLKVSGKCGATFHGEFEDGDQISGVYKVSGCKISDHGTIEATD
jgi:uncharacterized protein (DUF2147 family)